MNIRFLFPFLFIVLLGGSACTKVVSPEEAVLLPPEVPADTSSLQGHLVAAPPFQLDQINAYGDSLSLYFQTFMQDTHFHFILHPDTLTAENHTEYRFQYKGNMTGVYRTGFSIFEFPNVPQANHYYNDLKTQELVARFGINKRPNHILVDSNKVYWHRFEHGYGHRMTEMKAIFRNTFRFYPTSTNLDSVSGFTYCQCQQDDSDLSGITGSWQTHQRIPVSPPSYRHISTQPQNQFGFLDSMTFEIRLDTVWVNRQPLELKHYSSLKLPDSKLFVKYDIRSPLTPECQLIYDEIAKAEQPMTRYTLIMPQNIGLELIILKNKKAYLIFNKGIYRAIRI